MMIPDCFRRNGIVLIRQQLLTPVKAGLLCKIDSLKITIRSNEAPWPFIASLGYLRWLHLSVNKYDKIGLAEVYLPVLEELAIHNVRGGESLHQLPAIFLLRHLNLVSLEARCVLPLSVFEDPRAVPRLRHLRQLTRQPERQRILKAFISTVMCETNRVRELQSISAVYFSIQEWTLMFRIPTLQRIVELAPLRLDFFHDAWTDASNSSLILPKLEGLRLGIFGTVGTRREDVSWNELLYNSLIDFLVGHSESIRDLGLSIDHTSQPTVETSHRGQPKILDHIRYERLVALTQLRVLELDWPISQKIIAQCSPASWPHMRLLRLKIVSECESPAFGLFLSGLRRLTDIILDLQSIPHSESFPEFIAEIGEHCPLIERLELQLGPSMNDITLDQLASIRQTRPILYLDQAFSHLTSLQFHCSAWRMVGLSTPALPLRLFEALFNWFRSASLKYLAFTPVSDFNMATILGTDDRAWMALQRHPLRGIAGVPSVPLTAVTNRNTGREMYERDVQDDHPDKYVYTRAAIISQRTEEAFTSELLDRMCHDEPLQVWHREEQWLRSSQIPKLRVFREAEIHSGLDGRHAFFRDLGRVLDSP